MADQINPNLDAFLGAKQRPRWRKWLVWGLVALGVVLLVLLAMRLFGGSEGPRYSTAPVRRGDFSVTVSATGKLAPTNQVTVGSELSGLVTRVLVDVNDRVAAGQPLALIDPAQLDDQIRQTRAQLAANRAAVAQQRATLVEAQATLARFEEVSRLSGGRVPAKTELDTARAAVQRAVANVRAAEANVAATQAQLSSNQTQRSRAVIRSPVNGVVLARQVDAGQTVAASFNTPTLFVIAEDLSRMELEVAIDEADVGQVREGQAATFTVDAFPGETFPARITRVDLGSNLSAQTASSSSSSTTATSTQGQVVSYAAALRVANPDLRLRPGMTATAEIVTEGARNVLLVPNAALRFTPTAQTAPQEGGMASAILPRPRRRGPRPQQEATIGRGSQQTVYVLSDSGEPRPVQIVTGSTNGQMTQVLRGGLRPGQSVIVGQLSGNGSEKRGRRSGGAGGGPRGAGGGGGRGQ